MPIQALSYSKSMDLPSLRAFRFSECEHAVLEYVSGFVLSKMIVEFYDNDALSGLFKDSSQRAGGLTFSTAAFASSVKLVWAYLCSLNLQKVYLISNCQELIIQELEPKRRDIAPAFTDEQFVSSLQSSFQLS